jgi:hypothetical protein
MWHPDAIEGQLAHVEGNEVRAAYARAAHWDERVEMMQWWADYLDDLERADAGANELPVSLKRSRFKFIA